MDAPASEADARRHCIAETVVTGARGAVTACIILSRQRARVVWAQCGKKFLLGQKSLTSSCHNSTGTMADDAPQSLEELVASLEEHKASLAEVDELLRADPTNAEFLEVKASLQEVIELTEDLVKEAGGGDADDARPAPPPGKRAADDDAAAVFASLIGSKCRAKFDNVWYDAVVDGVNESNGSIKVTFTQYGTVAELDADDIKGAEEGAEGADEGADTAGLDPIAAAAAAAREVYKGVPAPKRVRVDGDADRFVKKEMPKKLMIIDGDDEATRERKRRQIKAFKGKQRMAEMDAEQNAKKNSWQSFQSKSGGKKRTGFMTKKVGTKKDSMFRVPDGGRVGVTGSGQAVTDYTQRKRYDQ